MEKWTVARQWGEVQKLREKAGILMQYAIQISTGHPVDDKILLKAAQEVAAQNLVTYGAITALGYTPEEVREWAYDKENQQCAQ